MVERVDAVLQNRSIHHERAAMFEEVMFYETVEKFTKICHDNSKAKGFWDGPENDNIPTKIALIHSELSEMLEAYRKRNPPCDKEMKNHEGKIVPLSILEGGKLRVLSSMDEEAADVFIRLCDLCGRLNIDLARVAMEKHRYNVNREHMHGGKRV